MRCQLCGQEITGAYARFKKFGSDEYMSFHTDNEANGRSHSCWEMWMERNFTYPKLHRLAALPYDHSDAKAHPHRK
jgi:hypothetical protein